MTPRSSISCSCNWATQVPYNLSIICLGESSWHLSCLVFSELPGSVIWCLTLNWGKFSVIIASDFLMFFSIFLLLVFPLHVCYAFIVVPQFLNILRVFFFSHFFHCVFQFRQFLFSYPQAQRVFPQLSTLLIKPLKIINQID